MRKKRGENEGELSKTKLFMILFSVVIAFLIVGIISYVLFAFFTSPGVISSFDQPVDYQPATNSTSNPKDQSVFARKNPGGFFLLGLMGGLLTFGGAYTAIPFIQYYAVQLGGWLTSQQFLDGLAIGSVLPSPLVIFATFVGFIGGGAGGAILMTIGMFLPAFSFTLIGHHWFEKAVNNRSIGAFLDGVTAGVAGLIAVTALQLLELLLKDPAYAPTNVVVFFASLGAIYYFTNRYAGPLILLASALSGQILYFAEAQRRATS